ncbi:MAG: ADP-L-glycero-D-manno-heptose-6-epimerase [Alphaproteobacteria bacterium ADurb.Bin438]|nr:MAG: ADP-L-glycero-D-manno-heptose-6-epimerase [Alphaproteobacteria bacterium ADurb.Bin438]
MKKNKSPSQWVGLKFFSVYGPNEYHKESGQSLVAQAYPHAAKEKSFTLFKSENDNYKDGEQMRDFVYVNDCVDVVLWFLKNKNVNGLYNVGTGTPRTFYDVAISVYKSIGIEPKIKYDDMPSELLSKYQYFAQADIKSLRNAGYTKPFTSLEDGVRDYVINYLHTSDPYK